MINWAIVMQMKTQFKLKPDGKQNKLHGIVQELGVPQAIGLSGHAFHVKPCWVLILNSGCNLPVLCKGTESSEVGRSRADRFLAGMLFLIFNKAAAQDQRIGFKS
ncbi:hypothetical protein QQ045_021385 [Rhodiola kirilowii]